MKQGCADATTGTTPLIAKNGAARFKSAKGAESVSLRVRAADHDGHGIDQTVVRAFGLK
ncbi:hypothetical protein [Streptomyces sp. NPDC050988]|uniref:hypothetical protein n=1 Tax=Streptomyces sp. NPDC050988 TaxID=3365637 RepID=UPI00378847EB